MTSYEWPVRAKSRVKGARWWCEPKTLFTCLQQQQEEEEEEEKGKSESRAGKNDNMIGQKGRWIRIVEVVVVVVVHI